MSARIATRFAALKAAKRKALVPFVTLDGLQEVAPRVAAQSACQ